MDIAAVDRRAERLPVVGAAPAGAGEGADIMVFLSGITPLSIIGDGVSDTCLSAVHVALVSVSVHAHTLGREGPARHIGHVHSNTILYTVLEWSMEEALRTSIALELLADMYAIYVCRAPSPTTARRRGWRL